MEPTESTKIIIMFLGPGVGCVPMVRPVLPENVVRLVVDVLDSVVRKHSSLIGQFDLILFSHWSI